MVHVCLKLTRFLGFRTFLDVVVDDDDDDDRDDFDTIEAGRGALSLLLSSHKDGNTIFLLSKIAESVDDVGDVFTASNAICLRLAAGI